MPLLRESAGGERAARFSWAMSAGPGKRRELPGLRSGFLAALPLFAAYELGLVLAPPGVRRSAAEFVLGRGLALLGEEHHWVRWAVLAAAGALCWVHGRSEDAPGALGRELVHQVVVGILAGMLLAPLLYGLVRWLGAELAVPEEPVRSLPLVLRLLGAAPWEELLFRVGAYGLLFLVAHRALRFLGLTAGAGAYAGELAALLGSAFSFALFHLDSVQRWIGSRGEPYDGGVFLWRVSAGILLGALFRWRGLGVSAWAHAVFNLGLALGVGRP